MTDQDIKATLTISLLAAYADRSKHDREREEIRRIAEGLAGTAQINLAALYQDVLLKRTSLEEAASQLQSDEARQLAYEMAVCVCDADGSTSPNEHIFLHTLRQALGLSADFAHQTIQDSEALADAPLADEGGTPAPLSTATSPGHPAADRTPAAQPQAAGPQQAPGPQQTAAARTSTLSRDAIDQKILQAALTNGAIELLPESLSTMAIIPLQMRLVYQIGESYGYSLDKGHIRDFLATVGVGMTSQYLEQAGRKLLSGLLGKKRSKGLLGSIGKQAVSSGMSFAATYALGHVASQYYAGGRTLSAGMLKNTYNHILQQGQALHTQYLPEMQVQARTLDTGSIMALVRGNG